MNRFVLLSLFFYLLHQVACIPEEEIFDDDIPLALTFSADTILFDTLFVSRGSITKRLKIYNPNKNKVNVDRIYLGKQDNSEFEIAVSGVSAYDLSDVAILGNDSLLILVSVNMDPNDQNLSFLVKDSIILSTNSHNQDVKLIAWGQNARFLGDSILSSNTVWDPDLPYVLYKSILVDSLCELTIEAGTQIYSAPNAYLIVKGTLKVTGDTENRVIFLQERQEEKYRNIPGQWGGIIFLEGSVSNHIGFTDIRNAQVGLRIGTPDMDTIPDVKVYNTKIENMTDAGILSFTSDLYMENSLVNNCGVYMIANLAGGNYEYVHCTFINFTKYFYRQIPSVVVADNVELENGEKIIAPVQVKLVNSILWGDLNEEIMISYIDINNVDIYSSYCILKTSEMMFNGSGNQLSTKKDYMKFKDPDNYDFRPDSLSPAINQGISVGIEIDLDGMARDSLPDIGAYEFIPGK